MSSGRLLQNYNRHELIWVLIFSITLTLYIFLAYLLANSFDFNDETEKLIAARLIADSGFRLYKEIFVQHGPTAYMFSHALYALTKSHSLAVYRIIPITLSLITLASLMMSPLFKAKYIRLMVGSFFLFGLIAFQAQYAFVMTMYQVYAGYFYLMALATFFLPFALGKSIKSLQAFWGGFCLSMMFFCAFSFAFAIVFCMLLCIFGYLTQSRPTNRNQLVGSCIKGCVVGTLVVALWFSRYSDFTGYFIYHVYFSMAYYARYIAFSYLQAFNLLNPFFFQRVACPSPLIIFQIISVISLVTFSLSILQLRLFGRQLYRYLFFFILITCVLIFANPRSSTTFGGSTYIIVCCGFISMISGFMFEQRNLLPSILIYATKVINGLFLISGLLTLLTVKTFLYEQSSFNYYTHKAVLGPLENEQMLFLRKFVRNNDAILQLPFNLIFYVHADRMPASGIFYWVPWMDDYAKNPVKNYPLDLCYQMNQSPPKAIFFSNDAIWENDPNLYMSCFKKLLKNQYSHSYLVQKIWFRNDIVAAHHELRDTLIVEGNFKKITDSQGQCLLSPAKDHGKLQVGDCSNEDVLMLLNDTKENKLYSLQSHECLDLQSETQQEPGYVRLWPCMVTPNQVFIKKPDKTAFYLQNPMRNVCLVIKKKYVVGGPCDQATAWKFLDISPEAIIKIIGEF